LTVIVPRPDARRLDVDLREVADFRAVVALSAPDCAAVLRRLVVVLRRDVVDFPAEVGLRFVVRRPVVVRAVVVLRPVVLRAVVRFRAAVDLRAVVLRTAVDFRAVVLRALVDLRAVVALRPAVVDFLAVVDLRAVVERPRVLVDLRAVDDLRAPVELDFVSPDCARCLLTVRAAISSARSSERPCAFSERLISLYWRSRLLLHAF